MDRRPDRRRPLGRSLGALLALFGLAPAALPAVAGDLEAKVKAAYLYHLTKFVDWPSPPTRDVRICVLGSEAVGSMMADLANRQVRDLPLKIEVDAVADMAQCQVLFIGRGDRRLADILRRLRGTGVLTVSDADDFARQGGMVGFYLDGGKVRLEVNPEVARAANIRISAKLLELARTVP